MAGLFCINGPHLYVIISQSFKICFPILHYTNYVPRLGLGGVVVKSLYNLTHPQSQETVGSSY